MTVRPIYVLAALLLVSLLPLVGDNYVLRLGTMFAMYAVLAQSWNIIGGYAGYPSFATAAFFGLGAYAGAILQGNGLPMPLAWLAAGIVAGLFAALMGAAILHLKGHYFAIASLVLAEVLLEVTTSWTSLTGGGMGLNLPVIRMSVDAQAQLFFWAMLGLAVLAFLMSWYVSASRIGFALRCIRQNEDASSMVGVNTTFYKVVAFVLSALFVGSAGALYASWVFYIEPPDVYSVLTSVKPIVMVMLGGAGTVAGPVIGAAAFLVMEEVVWRNFLSIHSAVLGLLIVALIFFLPNGVLGFIRKRKRAGADHGKETAA
ncbi:inner-membrane translocator [Nitratireductor aquibiodomus RA22]|uniref:Amino acid/amide ABC transporter membrane protein 2, HAAT family n=2 Tax=Nitratireductor aquibiodomus TaxID=204799 RepID=A0A1H4MLC2_9HYPH|nr:branched-chain amino acid ABC transporter permease [Nitratireductor aquibiodomus]EIM71644.1 inner-membrane translocator [Nitratireductor aquibiodomus RA22]SEB83871.1 amino acid/amide ABC transporter membrane protein 2, HAAT family [Nitratireductor aquibiodomus]